MKFALELKKLFKRTISGKQFCIKAKYGAGEKHTWNFAKDKEIHGKSNVRSTAPLCGVECVDNSSKTLEELRT